MLTAKFNLPPGMSATDAELFFDGQTIQIIHNKQVYPWAQMPAEVKEWLTAELTADTPALALLQANGITRLANMLYTYAKCRFGGYNLSADLQSGQTSAEAEHWNCGCAATGQCCLRPIFRKTLHVANGVLNAREIEVAIHIAQGQPVKNIAQAIGLCVASVDKIKQSIFSKTGFYNSAQIASWAAHINLV